MSNPSPEQLAVDHGLISVDVLRQQPEQRLTDHQLSELRSFLSSSNPSSTSAPASAPTVEDQLAMLLNKVNELASANQALEQRLAQQPSAATTSPSLVSTAPPMDWQEFLTAFRFSKTDVNIFVAQITNYVAETTGWRDDAHKVRVCASYLSGAAYDWMSSYLTLSDEDKIKPEYKWVFDFSLFKKKLITTWGDPDKKAADARRLHLLRQTGAASLYAAEFRRLSLSLNWGDEAFQYHFVNGLKEELKDELARLDPINDFDTLVDRVVLLDNRAYHRRLQKAGKGGTYPIFTAPRPSTASETPAEDRMQVDANRKPAVPTRRGPLTQAEKDHRRKNNLCSYCGGAGHFQDACPALAARGQHPNGPRPLRTAAATFHFTSPHLPDNSTEPQDDEQSGKDPRPAEEQD
ncbi:hypothetical protein JCM1840_007375 [Sporobolomyces johnsonii]